MTGPAVLVVGEALIDLAAVGGDRFAARPGGAPANVAVALARLGMRSQFVGRLSTDRFGAALAEHLVGNGVDVAHAVSTTRPATLAVVHLAADGGAEYSFYVEGTADWYWPADELPEPPAGSILVVGSLALAREPGAAVLERFAAEQHRRGRLVAYDPNIRPVLAGSRAAEVARVERQLGHAHLAKASEDDLAWLYPDRPWVEVARHWRTLGPAWVTVTRGPAGAFAVGPSGAEVDVPGRTVDVVDTIGAGDAFLAGLLAGLIRFELLGPDPAASLAALGPDAMGRVMADAVTVAALTCGRAGADPPTAAELAAASAAGR